MGGNNRLQFGATPVASNSGGDELLLIMKLESYICLASSSSDTNNHDIHIVGKSLKCENVIETFSLSREELASDNGDSSTSPSWACISDIFSELPIQSDMMYWLDDQDDGETVPIKDRDKLVALILQKAREAAAMQTEKISDASSSNTNYDLQLYIKFEEVLDDYDTYASRVQQIQQQARIQEILDESRVLFMLPVDEDRARSWIRERLSDNNLLDDTFDESIDQFFQELRHLYEVQSDATIHMTPASEEAINSLKSFDFAANNSTTEEQCTICLEQITEGVTVTQLPCSHVYHAECAKEWLQRSHMCPLCRFPLQTDQ